MIDSSRSIISNDDKGASADFLQQILSIVMDNFCDSCKVTIDYNDVPVSIPLDKDWNKVSGYFCSIKCALYHNRFFNTGTRMVIGWEERENWLLQKNQHVIQSEKRLK